MSNKYKVGDCFPETKSETIQGKAVSIPDPAYRWTHIQFLRFANCPICNLHLRSFIARSQELAKAQIREILVFHSQPKLLFEHKKTFPFDVIGDPEKILYQRLGVEASPRALLDLHVIPSLIKGYRLRPSLVPDSSAFGLPADFLISSTGKIVNCKYGEHADDQWSVDELLKMVAVSPSVAGSEFDLETSEILYEDIGASKIAYRKVGSGEPLVLLHGYPLSGLTFRKIVPALASRFTCYVLDLPGAGETEWTAATDFGFTAQAQSVKTFLDRLGLKSYALLAHDTGGTIGRQLAILEGERVTKFVLVSTEIPGHRPPWIPLFQKTANPNFTLLFRRLMRWKAFRHSSAGFGGCFTDLALIDGDFYRLFLQPLIASKHRTSGQIHYLLGIDWKLVDSLKTGHAKIKAPTLLIWGEDDPVFPIERAREMLPQFQNGRELKTIPNAKLFVHEEQPELVAKYALDFLTDSPENVTV